MLMLGLANLKFEHVLRNIKRPEQGWEEGERVLTWFQFLWLEVYLFAKVSDSLHLQFIRKHLEADIASLIGVANTEEVIYIYHF